MCLVKELEIEEIAWDGTCVWSCGLVKNLRSWDKRTSDKRTWDKELVMELVFDSLVKYEDGTSVWSFGEFYNRENTSIYTTF